MQNTYRTQDTYTTAETYTRPDGHQYDERSLGDLFGDVMQDARTLISDEIALARNELSEKASLAGKSIGFIAAGGFVMYAGFLAIIAAIIVGISAWIPMWLSALIVGVAVAIIGYALVRMGLNGLKPEHLAPKQTADSIKETKEWAQAQTK